MIFSTAFAAVFPLFAKIAIGYGIKTSRLLSERSLREMNALVFKVFLPTLLFSNIYKTDFSTIESYHLLWYALVVVVIMFLTYLLVIPRFVADNHQRGVVVQGICRSNFILFGIPMAATLYGGVSAGLASLLAGIVVPMFNMLSVIVLEYFRGQKPDYRKMLKGVVTNPIILGGLLGSVFALTGLRFPALVEQAVFEVADIATPLALIILGGSVTFSSVKHNLKPLVIAVLNRLVIVPAIGLGVSILLGFRNLELILLLAMFASPAAVSSYTMAQQMDGDADLAGQIVVFSTLIALVSLFLWISLLMALRYM
ncbi:MAG: AEC family transporter [Sphaerochaeta sp.]|jgi:hypothetical protein|uniref:AEC family transporter n=1 Tax=Sphaerochaeta sp. TaxID=1972642 RepID=UPI002FC6324F